MRAVRGDRGLPFLPLDLRPGFGNRRGNNLFVGSAPFPEFGGADAPPRTQPEQDEFEEGLKCEGGDNDQFSTNCEDACWRVLFRNAPSGDRQMIDRIKESRKDSLIGTEGHIERTSAWIHLLGSFGFLLFALTRPATMLDSTSLSGRLSSYTSIVLAITFAVSTGYHTLGTVDWLAPTMRAFDHGAIDVALAVAATTDMSVVTLDFDNVPWQTTVDAFGVALVILCFFVYRRLVLPSDDTKIGWGDCRLGLFRIQHADFEYSALRSSGYIVLAFGFVSLVPAALRNLSPLASATLIACNGVSLILLIMGMYLDNVLIWPDTLYKDAEWRKKQRPPWACHNETCGCIMTSHAWWHVFSLVSVVTLTVGREVAISDTTFHTHPHT